ncbi:hypothetical protein E2562_022531 [Oryza meyeriana var. granulata]|uniref:Uncharacterized protein n=1 Tax=Oryza meyeriana var. granulata TaxID=110450 RepID=A0A6G1FAN1_9ORYZ|nr:hypothetical protein E2562_022531 [Oryza meyeriana var. granulata]
MAPAAAVPNKGKDGTCSFAVRFRPLHAAIHSSGSPPASSSSYLLVVVYVEAAARITLPKKSRRAGGMAEVKRRNPSTSLR